MNCKSVTLVELRKQFLSTLLEIAPQINQLFNECKFVYIFSFIDRTFLTLSIRYISDCVIVSNEMYLESS